MHFDETGKYVKSIDMHNSKSHVMIDHLSTNSNRICKSKCLQYKATRPTLGNRYANGQVRCQTCEIYLTENGAVNGYCLCCNMRVRSKPRSSLYKEKYNQTIQNKPPAYRNAHDSWIDTNEDYRNIDDENSNEKKSTPVYEEIDESVKTFYEFKDFLDSIKLQANYQLVMLKELIEYGENHKGEIAESLAYFNNKDTTNLNVVKFYFDVPVYDVLLNHGFVITTGYKYRRFPIYKLNVHLNESQKIGVLEIIENKLNEYNQLNEIPENEFPNSDNRGSIVWNSENSFEKFKPITGEENSEKSKESTRLERESKTKSRWDHVLDDLKTEMKDKSENYSIPTFAKTCPKCNVTQVIARRGQEFEEKIEESFGYRSNDPDNPDKKIPQSWCRQCRSSQMSLHVETASPEDVDTKIFNFDNGELNIQNCKVLSNDTIKKDQILTNDEIMSTFNVGNMGGIRYTKYNNVIVLLSTYSDDYDDSIDLSSGFITYTGEGKGDQEIKNGNEKIFNSQNTPMIFFKEVYQEPGVRTRGVLDNKYKFIGVVKYHKYNWATEKDRKVIKFVLEIVS